MLTLDNQSMKIKVGLLTAVFLLGNLSIATAAPIYTFQLQVAPLSMESITMIIQPQIFKLKKVAHLSHPLPV